MFKLKKKVKELEKRIADLEVQVQSQHHAMIKNKEIMTKTGSTLQKN